jgi:hypothetical protein
MKGKKTLSIVLLVLGIVLFVLSLAADAIGLGGSPGFGGIQIAGILLGALAAVVGLLIMRRK